MSNQGVVDIDFGRWERELTRKYAELRCVALVRRYKSVILDDIDTIYETSLQGCKCVHTMNRFSRRLRILEKELIKFAYVH